MILLPEADFHELVRKADLGEPLLPAADADGGVLEEVVGEFVVHVEKGALAVPGLVD